MVHAGPFEHDGLTRVVLRSGALVSHVHERWGDDYALAEWIARRSEGSEQPPVRSPTPPRCCSTHGEHQSWDRRG